MNYAPVSVIIPCYNGKDTIERAIRSVYNQTWRPAELIVVDDGSNRETVEFLRELKLKYGDWMKLIELEKNSGGPSIPRNIGWDNATQPYIAFLDHDDAWHPRKIEIQLNFMLQNPEIDMTGHAVKLFKSDKSNLDYELPHDFDFKIISKSAILFKNLFPTSSVVLKRNLPFRFILDINSAEDYHLWLSIILSSYKSAFLMIPLSARYKPFFGYSGLSGKLWEMERNELRVYFDLSLGKKIIPKFYLPFLISFSLLKFLRRLIISLRWR